MTAHPSGQSSMKPVFLRMMRSMLPLNSSTPSWGTRNRTIMPSGSPSTRTAESSAIIASARPLLQPQPMICTGLLFCLHSRVKASDSGCSVMLRSLCAPKALPSWWLKPPHNRNMSRLACSISETATPNWHVLKIIIKPTTILSSMVNIFHNNMESTNLYGTLARNASTECG